MATTSNFGSTLNQKYIKTKPMPKKKDQPKSPWIGIETKKEIK